jgi:hypothetical protein
VLDALQAIVEEWKQRYHDNPGMYPVDRIRPATPQQDGSSIGGSKPSGTGG